jgi:hypothetical protein
MPGSAACTQAVAVVVPARNEELLVGASIGAIREAFAHPRLDDIAVRLLVVVLDDCHDATALRVHESLMAPGPGGHPVVTAVVPVANRNVGRSRAFGARLAANALARIAPGQVWLATTDADSAVPGDWLAHQLDLRDGGADACAGTIAVDSWDGHPATAPAAFGAIYQPGGQSVFGHPHVHGTNLGLSMAAYLEVGGFAPLVTGEDHALWDALVRAGHTVVATPMVPVTTSGRRRGRSPDGFAATLQRIGEKGTGPQEPWRPEQSGMSPAGNPHRPGPAFSETGPEEGQVA